MIDSNHSEEAPDLIQENQFLDPPISPHYRRDETEEAVSTTAAKPSSKDQSIT